MEWYKANRTVNKLMEDPVFIYCCTCVLSYLRSNNCDNTNYITYAPLYSIHSSFSSFFGG